MSGNKTPSVEPLTYANEQTLPDGTYIAYDVHIEGEHFVCTTTADREESTEVLAPAESDLFAVLAMKPEVLRVGTGITEITTSGPVSVHRLLGALVVDDPDAEMVQADAWADLASHASWLGVNVDRWREQDLEMTAMRVPEGCELVPRWIAINGDRGFVLRGEQIAAVGLVDPQSDWNQPMLTEDLLSWGFYGESGGPCSWDGGAELGWCGPRLWGFKRWGDIDPGCVVLAAPAPQDLAATLADWISSLDWELAYLLAAVGMPGLDDGDRQGLRSANDVEGPWVSTALGDELDAHVVELLCEQWPVLREAVDGLRDRDGERGRLVYAWLRQIAHGDNQSGSWNQVHAAMLGRIDPPADDQRAPTMAERWDATMRRAESVMAEALDRQPDAGQGQPDGA